MAQELRDYYEVLGVRPEADPREIKRAYRTRAKGLHPDTSGSPLTRDGFHELVEAYEILSNPRSRLLYDRLGFRSRRAEFPDTEPIAAEVELGFYEARLGAELPIEVTLAKPCPACRGSGLARTTASCEACGGKGRVRRLVEDEDVVMLQLVECPDCDGGRAPCPSCDGVGHLREQTELRVRVPAGVRDGDRLRVASIPGLIGVRVQPRPADSVRVRAAATLVLLAALGLLAYLLLR